jgi:hypothetical protein
MSAIDWEAKSAPWRNIGLQFRAEVEAIVSGNRLPVVRRISEGGKLRDRRIALGITQERAAVMARLSLSALKLVETDRGTRQLVKKVATVIERVEAERRLAKAQAFT